MAARAGQVEVVRCLLRNGALVDARARVGAFSLFAILNVDKIEAVFIFSQPDP